MKNIYLITTEKPSRLWINNLLQGKLELSKEVLIGSNTAQHIYITSDEEVKNKNWVIENITTNREPYIGKCFYPKNDGTVTDKVLERDLLSVKYEGHYETLAFKHNCKKIILTTDPDLITDGVQEIDDEFLEWFVKNPSCEFVEVVKVELNIDYRSDWKQKFRYKIIIPQEEHKQQTIEEAAEIYSSQFLNQEENKFSKEDFINGAKWMQERMYSEEEVINLLETQRGNSYVAVLSATKNDELASIALNAPKPGGMKQFKNK